MNIDEFVLNSNCFEFILLNDVYRPDMKVVGGDRHMRCFDQKEKLKKSSVGRAVVKKSERGERESVSTVYLPPSRARPICLGSCLSDRVSGLEAR